MAPDERSALTLRRVRAVTQSTKGRLGVPFKAANCEKCHTQRDEASRSKCDSGFDILERLLVTGVAVTVAFHRTFDPTRYTTDFGPYRLENHQLT